MTNETAIHPSAQERETSGLAGSKLATRSLSSVRQESQQGERTMNISRIELIETVMRAMNTDRIWLPENSKSRVAGGFYGLMEIRESSALQAATISRLREVAILINR